MELILDVESTIFQKGNPFSRRNKLCYVGFDVDGKYSDWDIEYSSDPYGEALQEMQRHLLEAGLLVGFNLKFDLHWLRRYLTNESGLFSNCTVWDCQLAEFILSSQRRPYPSLDESCASRGLDRKLDTVRVDYWENGIDTDGVPEHTLREYLAGDVRSTKQLYEAQRKQFEAGDPRLFTLFKAQCQDLLILAEMEWNGMKYDSQRSLELAGETVTRLDEIDKELSALSGIDGINWNSDDHLSAVLYGGSLPLKGRVPTQRILKDGTIKHGEKWGYVTVEYPRLVEPLDGTETLPTSGWSDAELNARNEGRPKPYFRVYSVGEPTLKSLRCKGLPKQLIRLILERNKLSKRESTYYRGLPEVIEEMDWQPDTIHGQLNQCVAITGRLSASRPNQQNFDGEIKFLFRSRYDD